MHLSINETVHDTNEWMHRDHPVVTPLSGFFTGLAFILIVPALFAALLNVLFPRYMVQDLFPLVLATLAVPIWLVTREHTRRFGLYVWLGIVATVGVVLGVGAWCSGCWSPPPSRVEGCSRRLEVCWGRAEGFVVSGAATNRWDTGYMSESLQIPPAEVNPTPLPLVMAAPRGRAKPPRHLADLALAERGDMAKELGLPAFRAKQVSVHYFERLESDAAAMTDLPANAREEIVAGLLPDLMTDIRTQTADKGTTVKTLWKLFDARSSSRS